MDDVAKIAAIKPSMVRFAIRYSDDSGDEIAVHFDEHDRCAAAINIECVDKIRVAPEHLEWLIGSLMAVRQYLKEQSNDAG